MLAEYCVKLNHGCGTVANWGTLISQQEGPGLVSFMTWTGYFTYIKLSWTFLFLQYTLTCVFVAVGRNRRTPPGDQTQDRLAVKQQYYPGIHCAANFSLSGKNIKETHIKCINTKFFGAFYFFLV